MQSSSTKCPPSPLLPEHHVGSWRATLWAISHLLTKPFDQWQQMTSEPYRVVDGPRVKLLDFRLSSLVGQEPWLSARCCSILGIGCWLTVPL